MPDHLHRSSRAQSIWRLLLDLEIGSQLIASCQRMADSATILGRYGISTMICWTCISCWKRCKYAPVAFCWRKPPLFPKHVPAKHQHSDPLMMQLFKSVDLINHLPMSNTICMVLYHNIRVSLCSRSADFVDWSPTIFQYTNRITWFWEHLHILNSQQVWNNSQHTKISCSLNLWTKPNPYVKLSRAQLLQPFFDPYFQIVIVEIKLRVLLRQIVSKIHYAHHIQKMGISRVNNICVFASQTFSRRGAKHRPDACDTLRSKLMVAVNINKVQKCYGTQCSSAFHFHASR